MPFGTYYSGCSCKPKAVQPRSAAKQRFNGTDKTVGTATHALIRLCPHCDVTKHGCAAAEAEVCGAIGEVNLFNVAARRQIVLPLQHFHHAGAALANTAAIVQVVQAFVGINAGIQGRPAEICTLNAPNLFSFLLKSDGGHGFCWISRAH
jgi:hypothetical protein